MIRFLPCFVLIMVAAELIAQITITNATFPVAGDTLKIAIDNSPAGIVPLTPPGGPQTWDFTSLQLDATQNIIFKPANQGNQGANVPGAELFTPLPLNAENYYNVTPTKFELQAYWGIVPYDLVANNLFDYAPPLPVRRAPLNFFDINAASSGFLELFLPSAFSPLLMMNLAAITGNAQIDSMRYRVSISGIDVVDAFGSVSIPGGTYNVLREKRTRYTETRLDAKIPPLGWLDITDNAIQAGFNGLGVDTTVAFYFHNDVAKEHIAVITLNNAQNAVTQATFKYISPCPPGSILYVKSNATGANNGTSWANAYTDLQSALANTCPGITQIWVAAGTYKPTTTTNRSIAFVPKNGVSIYGGFNGTETMLSQRNWSTNITTLSGDIGAVGNNADNSYNVIVSQAGINATAKLDGFKITGAAGGDYSGGIYVDGGSNPTISNCLITGNSSNYFGGGLACLGSSPTVSNCTFSNNSNNSFGDGVANAFGGSPVVTNCLFINNTVGGFGGGGGLYSQDAAMTVANCTFSGNAPEAMHCNTAMFTFNCIFWGNTNSIFNATAAINNCIVEGGYSPCTNCPNGNGNVNPLFLAPASGNYSLAACSPAIDTGNDNINATTTDLANNPRQFNAIPGGPVIDLGAYEYQSSTPQVAFYADADNDGFGNANAITYGCTAPPGHVANSTDCNDGNAAIHPGAPELCSNGFDDDCDGSIDETLLTFTGNGDGMTWTDNANWDNGLAPQSCNNIVIPAGKTVLVPAGVNAVGRTLEVNTNSVLTVNPTATMFIIN